MKRCQLGRFVAYHPYCKRCDKLILKKGQKCRK